MKDHVRERCILFTVACGIVLWTARLGMALVVSEIMYHPVEEGGTSQGDQSLEFIELYNDRAVFEDLSGYTFSEDIEYTFPPGSILGAKEYLVIAKEPNAVEAAYGITGVLGPYDKRLNDDGDQIELANEWGGNILSFEFNDARPWTIIPDGTGHSLILAKQAGDPDEASTWAPSTYIGGTPGGPDEMQIGPEDPNLITLIDIGHPGRYFKGYSEPSPGGGGEPTTDWAQIGFNDDPNTTNWLEGPSGYGYSNEADELQYIRTELNDMLGNYLSVYVRLEFTLTQEQIDSFIELRAEVYYDDDYVLYFNGTPVGNSDRIPSIPPAFNWGRSGGHDAPTANIGLTGWMHLLESGRPNVLAFQIHNATSTTTSDGFGSAVLHAVVQEPESGDDPRTRVVINEVLVNSDAPGSTDWIELYNPGSIAVDLSNMYLSDDRFDLLKYKIPDGTVLQPGEFWAVSEGTPPDGFPFGLDYTGEKVFLTAATDDPTPAPIHVLDAVRHRNLEPEMTFGRYPDGSNYLGILSSATREAANTSLRDHDIVINEIMYHHGSRDNDYDYIELYNRSTTDTISLEGWSFTDGIEYDFPSGISILPDSYLVVAKNPALLDTVYPAGNNLQLDVNLLGPYSGNLDNHSERIRLSYPFTDPNTQLEHLVIADEVTYYDGGRWPSWADGEGASMELRDPFSNNDTPDAWADSDESEKASWEQINFSIESNDSNYTHDQITVFGMMLLNRGEVLLDDIELIRNDSTYLLNNSGFESGTANWNLSNTSLDLGGNHIQSFVTTEPDHVYSGFHSLHLIATGHGDPGANRINQEFSDVSGGKFTFRGWARWLRGSKYLLLRTSREQAPVQPPRPAYVKELTMPLNLGTPGLPNSMLATNENRGPDIREIQHAPVLPTGNEPILVTTRVTDNDGVGTVTLNYRSEGSGGFTLADMLDDGMGDDVIAGDKIFTGRIPGASAGTMRAFYIVASDGSASTRFPTKLQPSADAPERTCLVRVGDSIISSPFATYRVWISNDVINAFTSRPNLSNELMNCTFVYNDTEVFYNAHIRFRGSPFLRGGSGRSPTGEHGYRIEFNPEQRFRSRDEINLDNTESNNRGPLQERASYWFYRKMGLPFSMQEYIRPVLNGNTYKSYEDVHKIDGDYIDGWFPDDNDGYIHKIDDYFEYNVEGTKKSNLDEGLKYDSSHPLIKETYRWGFEKRSHREDDHWDHIFDFAVAMNTSSSNPTAYEAAIESVIDPTHFARVLAVRHACGDWDSYGYNRGKNNYFYYASDQSKWYLLPWDIDFTLGSGHSATTNIFYVNSYLFPEVAQFISYSKYRERYVQALAEMVNGYWQTSYETANPPTPFDVFLHDADDALKADGYSNDGRRDSIKAYVRDRRSYILTQLPPSSNFEITTNSGEAFCTTVSTVTIEGIAPIEVGGIAVNGIPVPTEFSVNNVFEINVDLQTGMNVLNLQGTTGVGDPVVGATDSITVTRTPIYSVDSVTPNLVCNDGPSQLTILGNNFELNSSPAVSLSLSSNEIGFDAMYVNSDSDFDRVEAATIVLDDPENGVGDPTYAVHSLINLWNAGFDHGVFPSPEFHFAAPYNTDSSSYAVRFTGYIYAPTPGIRYFGVNSDEGFSLTIAGELVGAYPEIRTPATTDVTNVTVGTMSYDFPAAGRYYLVLDYFENDGGEEIEFFQTDETGQNQRLINLDAELIVYRNDVASIETTNVVVSDSHTLTCLADLTAATTDAWNIIITPQCDQANRAFLGDALIVIDPPVGTVDWEILPLNPVVLSGSPDGLFEPNQQTFTLLNTGTATLIWAVSKGAHCDWLELPESPYGIMGPGEIASVTVTLNGIVKTKPVGEYACPLIFSIGCNPNGPAQYQRDIPLMVTYKSDFSRDFVVNTLDLAALVNQWGNVCSGPDWCNGIDLDLSGQIDFGDYAIFAQEWLDNPGPP